MKKTFFIIFFLFLLTLLAAKSPPGLRWREISRNDITVIFPATCAIQAEYTLASASRLIDEMRPFWQDTLAGKIRIVLNDHTDDANGFATFFPYNLVSINLHIPVPDSSLICSREWIDLVLAHEMTHIFNLNAASSPFHQLRKIFGNMPALFPAVQLPPWVIEGLAVYGESHFTADGRLNLSSYPLMLAAVRRDNLFPGWSEINGFPSAWPGPTAKYLFGAGFMQYLSEKYGADKLRQYLERSTSRLVLFSSSRDFKKTFGEPLGKLWEAYRSNQPAVDGIAESGPAREPLTNHGFSNQYPCPLGANELAYYHHDYQGRGTVEILDIKSGLKKTLFKLDAVNSLSFAAKENKIYLSATEFFRAFSDFSDLYEFAIKNRKLKRLSRGQRLSQPLKKENSDEIYCVQRRDDRFSLALFDVRKQTVKKLSQEFNGFSQLSLSPDQNLLAAAVKPANGSWGIGVFSSAGELQAFVTAAGIDCHQPRWQNNQTLYFIQAGAKNTRLASLSLAGSGGSACDDPRLNGLQQFSLDNNGQSIYFTYYSGRGLEIARLDLAGLPFPPQELIVASSLPETQTATTKIASRPYRFWRDLLPCYWATAWRMGGDEFQAGIVTGGQDALGIHSFSLEGYYGFSSHRGNIAFNYSYDGFFPTLSLSYIDSSDFNRAYDYSLRSQELKLALLWPMHVLKRSQLYAYADLHLEKQSNVFSDGSCYSPGSTNGFRLGINFNSSREFYDSISPSDGARFALRYSVQPDGLGNKHASRSAQADLRHFIPLFRPGVLAWRLVEARGWNADSWLYTLGGLEVGTGLGDSQPFHLLRGFPAGYQWGDRGWQFNLEYRLPLFKIEKAVLPAVSLDRVYLNTFFDMGRLWHRSYSNPTAYSIGTEAVLRLVFGGAAAIDLSFGTAYGFGPKHSWCIYLRTDRSF